MSKFFNDCNSGRRCLDCLVQLDLAPKMYSISKKKKYKCLLMTIFSIECSSGRRRLDCLVQLDLTPKIYTIPQKNKMHLNNGSSGRRRLDCLDCLVQLDLAPKMYPIPQKKRIQFLFMTKFLVECNSGRRRLDCLVPLQKCIRFRKRYFCLWFLIDGNSWTVGDAWTVEITLCS